MDITIIMLIINIIIVAIIILSYSKILINLKYFKQQVYQLEKNAHSNIIELREFLMQKIFTEHIENTNRLQNNLQNQLDNFGKQLTDTITLSHNNASQHLDKLNNTIFQQLKEIRYNIDNTLTNNLTKSNAVYNDISKRLTLIDAAQKRIGDLSSDIISLQDILSDKQARGVFGEVQLSTIVKNIIPAGHYKFQHTLSNGKRADCVIELPEPTGKLVIDAKFPLEAFRNLQNPSQAANQLILQKQFKRDIKKHINDIAEKYIIPEQTTDCAIMFIPAESVFSEIHANYPELVEESYNKRVWLASPTTMMAILNTSNAVIKDIARQKEIKLIQQHLGVLSQDFERFQNRITALAKHIKQANDDVESVNISARKIVNRFDAIEKVEISPMLTEHN